jgi:hypothetical protein
MHWQMATLAYGRFGGPDAIRKQLTTEQWAHLPCEEFNTRRLSHPGVAYQKPLTATLDWHSRTFSESQQRSVTLDQLMYSPFGLQIDRILLEYLQDAGHCW